ncbi:hypothetical protein AKO1_002825, partial [Acrasis kona]
MSEADQAVKTIRLLNLRLAHLLVNWQGTTRVLSLSHQLNTLTTPNQLRSMSGNPASKTNDIVTQEIITQEAQAILERQQTDLFNMSLLVDITSIGISVIDNSNLVRQYGREFDSFLPKELLYIYMEGVFVQFDTTLKNQFVDVM